MRLECVAIELPEDIARQLESVWQNVERRSLEAIAIEGYRSGALTRGQVGSLLGLSYWETESLLKERRAFLPYDERDLAQDGADLGQAMQE